MTQMDRYDLIMMTPLGFEAGVENTVLKGGIV
jgi:hypothetical protein